MSVSDDHGYGLALVNSLGQSTLESQRPAKRQCRGQRDLSKDIFRHWIRLDSGSPIHSSKWKCAYCTYSLTHYKPRMVSHLQTDHGHDRQRDTFDAESIKCLPPCCEVIDLDESVDTVDSATRPRRVRIRKQSSQNTSVQGLIADYVHNLSPSQQSEAEIALSMFMSEKALPFNIFTGKYWNQFISIIGPAFQTPKEHKFRGPLLELTFEKISRQTKEKLSQAPALTIGIDECKLAKDTIRINFIACTPQPYFIESVDTKGSMKTTDYLTAQLKIILNNYNLKPQAIITDNCSNIKGLRRRLETSGVTITNKETREDEFIRCLDIYCLCHGVNLILCDFFKDPQVKFMLATAVAFAHKLNNRKELRDVFFRRLPHDEPKRIRFKIPPEVRWMYFKEFLASFLSRKQTMKLMIFMDGEEISTFVDDDKMFKLLSTDSFWIALERIKDAIDPFCQAILRGESTESTISEAHRIMFKLKEKKVKFVEFMRQHGFGFYEWSNKFDERFNEIISRHHRLASFLDPRYHGEEFTKLDYLQARDMIEDTASILGFDDQIISKMINDVYSYIQAESPFTEVAFKSCTERITSIRWWKQYASQTALFKLAVILLSIPCSNASVERSFSHQGLVFSKRRQNMSAPQMNKLMKLKFDLTSTESKKKSKVYDWEEIWADIDLEDVIEEAIEPEIEQNLSDTDQCNTITLE